jgi:predicted nucleotidyltransferase
METHYKSQLLTIIKNHIPHCRVWLFGSRARHTHASGSDVDLALDAGHILGMQEIGTIKEAISQSNIPVFVDIVDIRNVSEDFLNHIKKEWIEWTH